MASSIDTAKASVSMFDAVFAISQLSAAFQFILRRVCPSSPRCFCPSTNILQTTPSSRACPRSHLLPAPRMEKTPLPHSEDDSISSISTPLNLDSIAAPDSLLQNTEDMSRLQDLQDLLFQAPEGVPSTASPTDSNTTASTSINFNTAAPQDRPDFNTARTPTAPQDRPSSPHTSYAQHVTPPSLSAAARAVSRRHPGIERRRVGGT